MFCKRIQTLITNLALESQTECMNVDVLQKAIFDRDASFWITSNYKVAVFHGKPYNGTKKPFRCLLFSHNTSINVPDRYMHNQVKQHNLDCLVLMQSATNLKQQI